VIDDMPKQLPLHVHAERTRHSKIVFYFRRGQGPRQRLPEYGSPAFDAAYAACLTGQPQRPVKEPAESLAWLIARYKTSAHWAGLAPSTRAMRDNILKHVITNAGDVPYKAITRKHINAGIDARKPHAGNSFRKVMSQLFSWALSMDMVEANPVTEANRNKVKSDGFHSWTVAEVETFCRCWPAGSRERLAMMLLLFTGLRRSDVYRIGRQHVSGGVLSIKTVKTGQTIHVPMFRALREAIEATATADLAFMATEHGRPFKSAASFGNWFGQACRKAGVPGRAHGLRKAGATIAANSGATAHELMAMFGWKQISQAEVYTREADRVRLSARPAEQIANAFPPHHEQRTKGKKA
jgi:integrase